MKVHIGTSGWQYGHWRGVFYPDRLATGRWLSFYAQSFDTLELNVTFYREVKEATFRAWYEVTPSPFLFSVKMPRYITHMKRLIVDEPVLARFHRGVEALRDKLGVILIQLPPGFKYDRGLLAGFFDKLDTSLRYTVEARNPTFLCDEFLGLLEERRIAWCIADSAGRYPYLEALTAPFVYVRLHGASQLYASDYSEGELSAWRDKVIGWNRDAFVYFDNDFGGYAVKNGLALKALMGSPGPRVTYRE